MSANFKCANIIRALIANIAAVTGESYDNLTTAIQALKNGYGQGGGEDKFKAFNAGTLTEISEEDFEGTTAIRAYQFMGQTSILSVSIPDNVSSIGASAFNGCSGIEYLKLPISMDIGSDIFTGVSNVKTIEFNPGTGVGFDYSYSTYKYTPWYLSAANISKVIFSEGITKIGKYTFYDCVGLKGDVIIPSGVTLINTYAFRGCAGINRIYIPKSMATISLGAFDLCTGITDVYYEGAERDWALTSISTTGNDILSSATIHYNSTGLPE